LTNLGDRDPRAEARRARHGLAALVHPGSVVFRHAVRLAVVVAVAQWLSFVDPFGKSYWIPLTAAVVLKPTFATTVERGVQRIVGTILGVLVAFVATWLIGDREWALIAAFVGLTFALAALLEVNYALAVTGLTPAVILLLSIDGSTADLELDRLFGTVVGGAVALVGGYLLWPAWARFDLGTTLGRGASVEAHYLSTVTDLGRSPEQMRARTPTPRCAGCSPSRRASGSTRTRRCRSAGGWTASSRRRPGCASPCGRRPPLPRRPRSPHRHSSTAQCSPSPGTRCSPRRGCSAVTIPGTRRRRPGRSRRRPPPLVAPHPTRSARSPCSPSGSDATRPASASPPAASPATSSTPGST
jgi:hypothetical protein